MADKKAQYPTRFYELGPKASVFWDPSARNQKSKDGGLKVTAAVAVEYKGPVSKRMQLAIDNHHIVEVDKDKAEKINEEAAEAAEAANADNDDTGGGDSDEVNFEEMTKKELTAYYKENYEDVSDDDLEEFSSKNKADMIKFLSEDE